MASVPIYCWPLQQQTEPPPIPAGLLPPEASSWLAAQREHPPTQPQAYLCSSVPGLVLVLPTHSTTQPLAAYVDLHALQPSDAFFRTLIHSLQAVVWEADARTFRFTYVSPQAEALLGYPLAQWLEPNFWVDHIHPDDRAQAVAFCRETSERGEDHDFTYRMLRADGRTVWVRDIVTVIPDAQGRPERLRGLLLNVTSEQETRQALEVAWQRYQDLVEHNPVATGVYHHGRVVFANAAMAHLFGAAQPEVLLGKSANELIHPHHLEAVLENLRRILERGKKISQTREVIQRFDGSSAIVDFSGVPISWEGEPAVLFFMWDVSEQVRTAQRLAEREALYQAIFENAPEPMYVRRDRHYLLVNPAFARLTGYTAEELTDPHFNAEQLAAPQSLPVVRERLRRRQQGLPVPPRYELWIRRKDGSERLVEATSINIQWEGQPAVLGIFRDLTAQQAAEAYLQQARKKALEAHQLKSTFLELITHEIRTPLSTILGYAELLHQELAGHIPEELLDFLSAIRASGRRLLGLLSDILDLSLLETQRYQLSQRTLHLEHFAQQLAEDFSAMAAEKGLRLVFEPPANPVRILADEEALYRALRNVVHNAIKFTEKGEVRLRVGQTDVEGWIQVKDTGPGMDPAFVRSGLFEPFRQESEGLDRRHEGAGLGMAVTRGLVEAMHGRILVETAPGQGTTVTLYFPRPAPKAQQPSVSALHPEAQDLRTLQERLQQKHLHLLVVEDNPENARFLELALKPIAQVTLAADAYEALQHIDALLQEGQTFDLILLDLNLPGNFPGQALLHEIRRRPAYHHTPIVAQTAYAEPFRPEDFLREGFDGYLAKPIDRLTLYLELDRLLSTPAPS